MRIFDADVTGSLQVSGSSNFKGGVTVSGSQTVTGSLTVHGNAKVGDQITDTHTVTGSLNVTGSISGSLTGVLRTDYIDFNTGSTVVGGIGRMTWNDTDGTVDIGMKGGNVTLQVGQEQLVRVVNKSGVNLLESTYNAVKIFGAQGNRIKVKLAQADNDDNSAETLGLATENIDDNQEGFITANGLVRNINTTGALQGELWNDGDMLYLSPTVAGRITNIKPQAPQHTVIIGYVVRAHANVGSIFVKVDNGYEIDELHNVRIDTGSLSHGDLLMRSGSVWANTKSLSGSYQLTGSLDISGSQTINGNQIISGSITITQNISVLGTSSFVYVTSSNLNLTGPFIYTNVFEPIERFGGLVVFDSGSNSHLATASLLWDSLNNHWIYQNASGSMYSGGMLLSGPRNTGSLGDELGLTSTRIPKSVGGDHLDNSNIYDDGSKVKIISNTEITGSLKVTSGISGSIDYSYIQNAPSLVSGSAQINITGTTGYSAVSSSIATALNGSWRLTDGTTSEDINFNETVTLQEGGNMNITLMPGTNTVVFDSLHQTISAASSSNNSGRTYIQDILLDVFGHITGITTATETVVDTHTTGVTFNTGDGVLTFTKNNGLTYTVDLDGRYGTSSTDYYVTGGTFNTGTGNLRLTRNDGGTIDVDLEGRYLTAHPSVSAASSSNNSGRTYIQDILLDSFGHITGITTATETVVDTYTTGGTTNSTTGLITFTKSDGGTYTASISGYVSTQIANLVDSAPTTLDTLNELAAALGDDPNFATTIATAIGNKVSKSGDTMTGNLTAPKFITSGGTSSQFVKGDGTLDSNTYLTSFSETDTLATVTARGASTATPVTFNGNVTLGNAADLTFVDLAGTFPTSGKGFDWTLNNDGARIYAIQPSSDSIDFVFQLRDNATTNDRFVFHVDDYQGPAFDKYPLIIRGGTEFDLVNSALYVGGTLVLSNGRVLQNVTGNISMFTNDSGYLTAHPSVTAASSSNNSGRTYIQDILLDGFGHITGITTATETVVDTNDFINNVVLLGTTLRFTGTGGAFSGDIDLSAFLDNTNYYVTGGTFNTGTGNLRLTRNDGGNIDISLEGRYLTAHPSVSAASSSNNSGRTYIQDILLDSFGHITGITTATETVTDTFTTGATFNTSNGVITFTNNNGGGTFTVDIDGRFLTSYTEVDTLEDVVSRNGITSLPITAASFITQGASSSQFVKGDGTLDSNTYLTAHPSVSAASSSNNSGRTYIQDILLDSFGHITGITTATETVTDTNNFTTGATFNIGNGVVTFTRNDGGTYTVDLDGRYLESYSETDTLATVTSRGASTTTAVSFNGGLTTTGLTNNSNAILANSTGINPNSFSNRVVAGGIGDGGWGVTTGIGGNAGTNHNWSMGHNGSNFYFGISNGSSTSLSTWMQVSPSRVITLNGYTSNGFLKTSSSDGTLTVDTTSYYPSSNPSGYISSYLNYYTTGATFNTSNGVITFSRNDGNTYTVDIDGKYAESVHTHDDRYLPYAKTSDVNRAAGWYTIAANPGNRAVGRFILRDTSSGNHQSVVFYATHHYGNYSDITVLINSRYSGNPFRTLRIVDGSTYDGALLQVYIDDSSCQVQAWMLENIQNQGWVIKDWVADGVDPGDINNFPALTEVPAQVDLDQAPQGGIITTGPIYGGGDTTQYEYLNTNNYSTTTDTRYYTETEIGNFFGGSTAITGYNKTNWDTAFGWGNHSGQGYATTGYVQTQITNLIDSAPAALDTLNELAAALGDDANFATTITTSIGNKVSKSGDTMTGNLTFGTTSGLGVFWGMNTDAAFIRFVSTGNGAGLSYLEIGTQDDSDEPIWFTQSGNLRAYIATDGFFKNGSGYKYLYENGTWGINISGNAATVTDGVYTTGTYSNPAWITALAGSKITGNISGNASNITSYTINQNLGTTDSPTFNNVTATGVYGTNASSTRNKYNVYSNSGTYAIGMESGNNFGGLADWAMTFQMNNDDDRGFWWGDDGHNTSQGAMSLTTNGYLTVARGVRVGYGESDTTSPSVPLQVYGSGSLVFDVQGSLGQLFSVTDTLSGSLFSVNDISGLPVLEVFSDDRVVMGSFGMNSLVVSGTTTTVSGSLLTSGSFAHIGTATINGGTVWHSNNDGSGSGLDADTLDGYHASSFLTSYSETDTLATVTARGASTSTAVTFSGGFNDGYITFNLAQINRSSGYVELQYSSGGGVRMFGAGATPITFDTTGTGIFSSSVTASSFVKSGGSSSQFLMADGSVSTNPGWITSYVDTNYYVTSASFNTGNGIITLTRNDGGTVTVDIDGRYKSVNGQTEVNVASPASTSGTWTTATSNDEWGNPKFDTAFNSYTYGDAGAWIQFNIPSGMKSAWISQLCWSSGGYVDIHGIQTGGALVFLRRINTRQTVENTDEGVNHDGSTVTFVASGLDDYTAIRFTVQVGRFHLTGLSFSDSDNEGTEGVGMVHPAQISHQGSGSTLDADLLDGQHGSYYYPASNPNGYITSYVDTNYYTTSASFNTSNGIITFSRNDGGTYTVDIDGKYQEAGTYLGAISYNNDSNSTYQLLWGSGNAVYGTAGVYVNPSSDYVYAGSFVSSGWFRSTGNTGWYSETYGGGWYMTDTTWIRNYNSKQVYIDSLLEIGTGGIQNAGNWRILNSAGSGWANIIERNSGAPLFYGSTYYDFDNTTYFLNPASTSNLATVKLNSTASGTEVFTVDGVNGRLFTITDDLSDSLFSVNTIAGVPVIEAFSDYRVIMGRYNQNDFYIATTGEIGMGNTSVSGYKLAVTGNIRATAFVKTGGSSSQFLMADGSVSTNPGWITSYTDTNYYVTSASFNTSNGIITLTRNDGGTVTVDIDGKYAESSHTHDDRYFTETESDARFQPLENQRVSTSSTVRFSNTYTTAWFRNDNSNTGLYNETTTMHLSSQSNGFWDVSSTNSESSIRFYTGGHVNALRGYVYANSSNQIGFLNSGGNWGLRMDNSYNVQIFGALTVGSGTSSDIYMTDTDETTRRIHCNSSRIGFLSSSNTWGSWAANDGSWNSDQSVRAPIFYDISDTNYYLNPNGYSNLGTVRFNSSGANAEVVAVDGVNGRLFTVTDDMTDSIFSVNTISGLPVIEAFADYTVVMGRFGQNDFKIDGSTGAVTIRGNTVWHAGNDGASSGLDADLLDGQHGSYYQPASSAITTSNIGSQSVNYATSAGSASQVTINYNNDSNSTYQVLWGSGNSVYGTGGVYVNPYYDYMYATAFVSSIFGLQDGTPMDCYMQITDNNPTEDGINYGAEFFFYGDQSTSSSHLYFGGALIYNNLVVNGRITENSSIRYKKDIVQIENGLEKVLQLSGVTYTKINNEQKEAGVIAEEVAKILPEAVGFDTEGRPDSVSYGRLTALLIEAIKDLKKEIDELKGNK